MLSQEPGGTLPAGLLERNGGGWGGQSQDSCLAQSLSAVRRHGPAAQRLLPPKQGSEGLVPVWARARTQEWEEEQAEHREGTAPLSLWQPASDGEFLPPRSAFATEQPGAACKALLIARFPAEWQTRALPRGCCRQAEALGPCIEQKQVPLCKMNPQQLSSSRGGLLHQ